MENTQKYLELEQAYVAHNYHPLPVVLSRAEGPWVWDINGKKYLDCLAGYSSLNFGHRNERIINRAIDQLGKVTMTSRAFHTDQLGEFAKALCELTHMDMVLPMNTGAEAVESAIKLARHWGYRVKGVEAEKANIIVMAGNFHGRTTTIISFSDDPVAKEDFGPYTPGFKIAPFGDAAAAAELIDENTVAVLTEPIQGEAGVIIPDSEFFKGLRKACDDANVLLIFDEVQSGFCRTGYTFATEMTGVRPDMMTLGKALGGGVYPVSAVVGKREIMGTLRPGEHGSTFGGNPLAAAIGHEVCQMMQEGTYQKAAKERGAEVVSVLETLVRKGIDSYRAMGLWIGVDIDPAVGTARQMCEELMERGILAKDTHEKTVRLCPPLCVTEDDTKFLTDAFVASLEALKQGK
ncbi:MAG: ornithine--oxo-acid transaminase [Actinomycetaceae bacterium]|nr:ornithine--oxo-acid transaminase [Actinomycetaceae bacterium]